MVAYIAVALLLVVLTGLALSVRILKQYERAVIFRLGRVRGGARGPGLIVFVPFVDRFHRVSLRIITMPIQSQGIITRDNVSVDVSAVAYYRVADAIRSVVAIENASAAINQIAQTTLRAVVGRHTLDETLSETETINQNIREILDVQTEEWGMQVTVVELRDIQLPDSMQRAMARQAEAEREKRAKIIAAEGEALTAGELAHASDVMMAHPLAAAPQPPDPRRDLRRQELHGHLPGSTDEHDPGARRVPRPRDRSGRHPAGPARRTSGARRRARRQLIATASPPPAASRANERRATLPEARARDMRVLRRVAPKPATVTSRPAAMSKRWWLPVARTASATVGPHSRASAFAQGVRRATKSAIRSRRRRRHGGLVPQRVGCRGLSSAR
jgi:regulator of protease activity HflC (stomatin/prohibitin superfamily)